jgi:hypothetical protein
MVVNRCVLVTRVKGGRAGKVLIAQLLHATTFIHCAFQRVRGSITARSLSASTPSERQVSPATKAGRSIKVWT